MTPRSLTAWIAALLLAALVVPAQAAGTGLVFVSNEKSHEIVVLDSSYEIVKRIETSRRPRDMHFNAARTLLYVACGDDDVIDIVDVAKLEVVDSIPTGPSPEVFAFSPDEKLIYVSNEENSTLEVIDTASRLTVEDVPTGAEPEGVIVTPDGSTIYVTSEVADMVHVVDAKSHAVTKNILVGTRPRRFVETPDGSELWVARYDGPASLSDSPDALALDGSGNVYVTGTSRASPYIDPDYGYVTIKYGPDGSELWLVRYDGPAEQARALAVDGSGNVYVAGTSTGDDTGYGYDYATVKYSQYEATPTPTRTPTVTPTSTPTRPPGVGGTVKLPAAAAGAESTGLTEDSGRTSSTTALAGAAAGGILLLAAGGWYARRRYGR